MSRGCRAFVSFFGRWFYMIIKEKMFPCNRERTSPTPYESETKSEMEGAWVMMARSDVTSPPHWSDCRGLMRPVSGPERTHVDHHAPQCSTGQQSHTPEELASHFPPPASRPDGTCKFQGTGAGAHIIFYIVCESLNIRFMTIRKQDKRHLYQCAFSPCTENS